MRRHPPRALALLLVALVAASSPRAARADGERPLAAMCALDGLWTEHTANYTTRIASGRWRTWSGVGIDEATPPTVQGWLEVTSERLTFDFDDGTTGYSYAYRFEDGCDVLRIVLDGSGTEYRFTRGR